MVRSCNDFKGLWADLVLRAAEGFRTGFGFGFGFGFKGLEVEGGLAMLGFLLGVFVIEVVRFCFEGGLVVEGVAFEGVGRFLAILGG